MLAETAGDEPVQIRDGAILGLLSVYGLRSGEVRRLRLEDLDWQRERIQIVRSKTSRKETLPLEPSVGNAIGRYLRDARPPICARHRRSPGRNQGRCALSKGVQWTRDVGLH
jgi:integrase